MEDIIDEVFKDYLANKEVDSILHIGGEHGQEGPIYEKICNRFLYIEPIEEYANYIKDRGYEVMQIAVGDFDGNMYISGRASSLLRPLEHKISGTIEVECIPLSDIEEGFDTLVLDVQGAALNILKTGSLNDFNTIICEASEAPRYEGEQVISEITSYLKEKGFKFIKSYQHSIYDIYDLVFERI